MSVLHNDAGKDNHADYSLEYHPYISIVNIISLIMLLNLNCKLIALQNLTKPRFFMYRPFFYARSYQILQS